MGLRLSPVVTWPSYRLLLLLLLLPLLLLLLLLLLPLLLLLLQVTHALLVVSGWGRFSLDLRERFWLPDCRFLRFALHEAIEVEDVEMAGETLHVRYIGWHSFILFHTHFSSVYACLTSHTVSSSHCPLIRISALISHSTPPSLLRSLSHHLISLISLFVCLPHYHRPTQSNQSGALACRAIVLLQLLQDCCYCCFCCFCFPDCKSSRYRCRCCCFCCCRRCVYS